MSVIRHDLIFIKRPFCRSVTRLLSALSKTRCAGAESETATCRIGFLKSAKSDVSSCTNGEDVLVVGYKHVLVPLLLLAFSESSIIVLHHHHLLLHSLFVLELCS